MVLYQKYRPKTFSEFIGQSAIKKVIQNEIKENKISHSYLFSGPRGIGKTTMARLIAKAINCEKRNKGEFEPCNNCKSCIQINQGRSLNIIEIDAASNRGIDEIRKLKENVKFIPSYGKFKVFIIDEVHMLTQEAFNALLKTLEEPPKFTILILATTEPSKIPQTIISRCEKFNFKKLTNNEIIEKLKKILETENIKYEEKALQMISNLSDGSMRDAESILNQILALSKQEIKISDIEEIYPSNPIYEANKIVDAILTGNLNENLNEIYNEILDKNIDIEEIMKNSILILKDKLLQLSKNKNYKSAFELKDIILEFIYSLEKVKIYQDWADLIFYLFLIECANKQEFKKDINNKVKTLNQKTNFQNLEQVLEKWDEVLKQASKINHSLPAALNVSKPIELKEKELIIGIKFPVYKEVFEKNLKLLEDLLFKIYNKKFEIKPVIKEDIILNNQKKQDIVDFVKSEFGGNFE